MRRFNARILGSASVAALAITGFATPAFAQDAPSNANASAQNCNLPTQAERDACLGGEVSLDTGQNASTNGSITVTGSRIRRPNLESTVPITSVGIQELTDTGDVSLGDNLNDLPSLRSSFSQSNSTRFIGTAGLNLLDLRGLGTARTLVLVNNRRHITASPGDYLVDVNTIPITLVERVDIVTGGNSAIYGSDAVAGVVNFILRRDFDGLRFRAQAGISDQGDRGQYFAGIVWGRNFSEDRGNIAVALEYTKANALYFTDRPDLTGAYDGRCQFNVDEPQGAAGGEAGLSATDGITDTHFYCGVRNAGIYNGGSVAPVLPAGTTCTLGQPNTVPEPIRSQRCLGDGQPRLFYFNDAGQLVEDPINGVDFRQYGSGNAQSQHGSTLRDTGQLAAGLQRYAANLLARFEVARAFQPFLEAKYVHIDATQEGQPSFFQGSIPGFFGGGNDLRCNNAFVTPQILAQLQLLGRCANPATGVFVMNRFNVDFGGRGEIHDRDTYRIVFGFEGDFFDDWHYEIAWNYGHLRTRLASLNNLLLADVNGNLDGFLLATDAVQTPGGIVCGVNADADPNNNRPDCVPINLFGSGRPSQAALDFINTTAHRRERATEIQATAFVSGDSSSFFNLPGGPVGFALGTEYRRETAFSAFDDLTASGGTFLNAIQPFAPPALVVKEVYGEMRFPLLRDLPFAQELTVEGAVRYSDYNIGNTNHTFAYNIGGTWAPIRDIRFRANYSQSVRAPTQTDLFSTQSQNFAFIADPCDTNNIGPANGIRATNCAAFGPPILATAALNAVCASTAFPVAIGAPFLNCLARSFSTSFLQGGNPTLEEETSRSYTIGAVIEPRFLPGFSLTVDYYHINVKNLIAVLTAQTILNNCYDSPDGASSSFCSTVLRDPATGLFDPDAAVVAGGVNFARQITEGVDVEIGYRRTFGNGHRLNLRAIGTYVMTLDNYIDPAHPEVPNRQRSELGDPVFSANLNVNYDFGAFDVTYNMRYIGKQTIATYETQNPFQGLCTSAYANAGVCTLNTVATLPPLNSDANPRIYYPEVFYHNIRMGYQVNERFSFYAGVDNITDRLPPLGLLGTAGGDPFDSVGRYFYAGVNVNFR
jgi:outer membrane receptor protein involved in Fe transport